MRVLHILTSGEIGGIEILCKDFALYSKHENIILFLWGEGTIADEMRNNGTEVINLHTSPRRIIYTVKKLVAVCKKKNIEVIVVHHPAPLSHLCLILMKFFLPKIRRIAYAHSNAVNMCRENERKEKWLRKMILSCSLKNADAVIAISESVKKSVMEVFSIPEKNITVIHNGVDISRFQLGEQASCFGSRIVFVGRLIEGKGVQIIIEALRNTKREFYFDIVGDGKYRKTLEKMVCEYGLQERITFWGARSDVTRFLSHADIFVHVPILEEGFGITVVEAMASGLTCICSNSGGIPELIENGVTGYLVEVESVDSLIQILEKVMNHYNSQENMAIRENAKKKAEMFSIQNFSIQLDSTMSGNIPGGGYS
ncbi:glycosyltransferase family 4 protein [Blautia schinkii]|nr:glycosyltransferase family 4 protein [Blautia schinkii]